MLKKFSLALLLSSATALTASTAMADGVGFFLSGGGNYAQLDSRLNDEIDWEDDIDAFFDDKAVGYNLGAGYRFNKWLSVDAGYWDLGEFRSERLEDGEKLSFDTTIWTVGGMVSAPLWILDIYGRAGIGMWDVDSRYISEDGSDPYYGVGLAFNILSSLDLYIEYVRLDATDAIDTGTLGLRFTF